LVKAGGAHIHPKMPKSREEIMRLTKWFAAFAAAAFVAGHGPALADGDAAAGAKVFVKCKTCHELAEPKDAPNNK
jgi:cytochrome c2